MGSIISSWFHFQSGWLLSVTSKKSQSVFLVHIPLKLVICSKALQLVWWRFSYLLLNQIVLLFPQALCREQMALLCYTTKMFGLILRRHLARDMVKCCCRWPSWVLPQEKLKYSLLSSFSQGFVGVTSRYHAGSRLRPRDIARFSWQ